MTAKKVVVDDLNKLSYLVNVCSSFQDELGELIQQALRNCPDLFERFREINESIDSFTKDRQELIQKITKEVIRRGKTVKGEKLMAVYSNGRITWDTAMLNSYAVDHTAINEFKKIGKASVAFHEVKKEGKKSKRTK